MSNTRCDMPIEQYRVAAYEYCKIKGIDPEKMVPEPSRELDETEFVSLILGEIPRWRVAAEKIKEYHIMHNVLCSVGAG